MWCRPLHQSAATAAFVLIAGALAAAVAALWPDSPPVAFVRNVVLDQLPPGAPALRASLASCTRSFDIGSGFGPEGPRLWLWWTSAEAAGARPDAGNPTGTGWMMPECLAAMRRHAAPHARISIVNSSATRGISAPFRLRRFPLPSYFDDLPVNHQGDFGSFALLAEFGGVYLDTDMLLLHSLDPILRLLERFEFVGFGGHTGDRGVHHGLMASRPRSEVLVRAYQNALAAYEELGECVGTSCARRDKIVWLTTLEAFSRGAAAMQRTAQGAGIVSCQYARLPTRHFEPGLIEHESMCLPAFKTVFFNAQISAGTGNRMGAEGRVHVPADKAQYVSAVVQAALLGSLRVLHLSPSKQEYVLQNPSWRAEPRLAHCPLLYFLLNVSEGHGDLALAQRVGAENLDVFDQEEGDFWPGR